MYHLVSFSNLVNSLSISNAVNDQHRPGKSELNVDYANRNALWI